MLKFGMGHKNDRIGELVLAEKRHALTLCLVETHFNAFSNRADPYQDYKSCKIRVYSVCGWKYDKSDPTLVDLTSSLST